MKRSRLEPGKPLARGKPLKRGAGLARGLSRLRAKPLPLEERERRAQVREAVFRRDGGCRLAGVANAGRCFGPLTFHHRRKDGQGGAYSVENGATLCSHHNSELEADADLAALGRELGLVLRAGDAP